MTTHFDADAAELLSIAAHELKTPIGAVKGYIELIGQAGELNDKQRQFIDRALVGIQQMEYLVLDLLDMARLDSGMEPELQLCNIRALIEDAIDVQMGVAAERGIDVYIEIDDTVASIPVDEKMLRQVFSNLTSNAIKYNRNDGNVWIRARNERDHVIISIEDTGMGISQEDQERVFERFFRAPETARLRVEGSGLGLAITQAIIEKHGGSIWLESIVGEGTIFYFTLPLQQISGDGADRDASEGIQPGERIESITAVHPQVNSEQTDSVDDNLQEPSERSADDSNSDDV